MKTSSKIALALGAVAVFLFAKKKQAVSGIGAFGINYIDKIKARQLFKKLDNSLKIVRQHEAEIDAIMEKLESDGVDLESYDGERLFNSIAHKAGLTDKNGNTDVYVNYENARKELLNFIYYKILPKLPFQKEDIEVLVDSRNVVIQDKVMSALRKYVKA